MSMHSPRISSCPQLLVAAFIFVVATCSFFGNYFYAAPSSWFIQHQLDSEQLVLDGILHSSKANSRQPVVLGRYTRPEIQNQYLDAHRLFSSGNRDGDFKTYNSQYGLQVKVFAFLFSKGFSISALQLLVASCMAFCLSSAYLLLRANRFSGIASTAFALSLALGPWVIVFARNLYWVEFTWFAPSLVSALSATLFSRLTTNRGQTIAYLVLIPVLFCVVLARLLCGYEYITVIYLACLLAFVSVSRLGCICQSLIIKRGLIITLVFLLAFGAAIAMHASQLKALGEPGLQTIWETASKRTSSTTPAAIVEKVCNNISDPKRLKTCRTGYAKSLTSNPIGVAAKYLFVPSFLPWVGADPNSFSLSDPQRSSLLQIRDDFKSANVQKAVERIATLPPNLISLLIKRLFQDALHRVFAFPAFVAIIFFATRRDSAVSLALGGFFVGSASWFFAAKGHSYLHYHINYVLWYLLFVPVAVLLVVERLKATVSNHVSEAPRKTFPS